MGLELNDSLVIEKADKQILDPINVIKNTPEKLTCIDSCDEEESVSNISESLKMWQQ